MAGSVLSQALAFFALPFFTRYLKPDDFGILSYTGSVTSFLFILSTLSLNSFVVKYYFEIQSEKKRKELFGTIFLFLIAINIALLFIEFLVFPHALKRFDIKIPFYPYFEIALIINFLQIALFIPTVYYRVTRNAWGYFCFTSSAAVIGIVLSFILIVGYDMGVIGRYYGSLCTNLFFLVVCLIIMFKISSFSFNLPIILKGLRFSLPLLPGAIATIAIASSDRIILERYVSLSQLGIYSVGFTLGTALSVIKRGVYLAVEPGVYESFNQEGFEEKVVRLKNIFLSLLLCIGCVIIVFSKEIVMVVASERFYESYMVIPFFVIGVIFRGTEIPVGTTLLALNKTLYQPIIVGSALAVNIAGNLVLIPFMGIMGAAFASALAFMIMLTVSVYITNKFSDIRWNCLRDTSLIMVSCVISVFIMNIQVGPLVTTALAKVLIVAFLAFITFCVVRKYKMTPAIIPKKQARLRGL